MFFMDYHFVVSIWWWPACMRRKGNINYHLVVMVIDYEQQKAPGKSNNIISKHEFWENKVKFGWRLHRQHFVAFLMIWFGNTQRFFFSWRHTWKHAAQLMGSFVKISEICLLSVPVLYLHWIICILCLFMLWLLVSLF